MAGGPMERAVRSAVRRGLGGVRQQGRDVAGVELVLAYARALDGVDPCRECGHAAAAGELGKLGPQLLAALEALGLTPRARAAAAGAGGRPTSPGPVVEDPLERLRRQHAERERAG